MPSNSNKIALFIDGPNLYGTAKALGFEIDYKQLLKAFESRGTLLRAFYYTAVIEDQEFSSIRPLIDWLDYNGFTVVTKPAKEFTDASGRRKVKGNMDVEIAVDAMELAPSVNDPMEDLIGTALAKVYPNIDFALVEEVAANLLERKILDEQGLATIIGVGRSKLLSRYRLERMIGFGIFQSAINATRETAPKIANL